MANKSSFVEQALVITWKKREDNNRHRSCVIKHTFIIVDFGCVQGRWSRQLLLLCEK